MCKKSPEQRKAKVKCKCCIKPLDKEKEGGKLNLTELDIQFEQQSFIIDIRGD